MLIHKEPSFSILFGGEQERFVPAHYKQFNAGELLTREPFTLVQKMLPMQKKLIFLHQVHGNDGTIITTAEQAESMNTFCIDGDFLITNLTNIALGVATADCLPIILYDTFNHVISSVHAGWRGAVAGIAGKAFDSMQQQFGTQAKNIKVFFGPNAKVCCYNVKSDLVDVLEKFEFVDKVVRTIDQQIFFDLPFFNQLLLQEKGIAQAAFHLEYNNCTICDTSFCSYRRQNPTEYRQMTIVALQTY
jgi:polyphenol oxidase